MPENDESNLGWELNRLDKELDGLLKRIEELQDDLKIVLRFVPTNIVELARLEANKTPPSQFSGAQPPDLAFQEKCRKFVERYGSQ